MEILGFNIGRSTSKQHDIAGETLRKSINYIGTNLQFNKYQFKDYSVAQLIRQGYYVCSAVSSIITRYQVAYPEPFLKIPTVNDKEITDKLLLNALEHPNEWMSQSDLMRYDVTYRMWGGNTYIVKDKNAYGQTIGFFPFSDLNIVPIATKDNFVSHYDFFDITGQQIGQYAREDVIQLSWFAPDPYAPWKAISPMKLVAREIDTDVEFTKFLAAFISNDATPGVVLKAMKDAIATSAGSSQGSATKMLARWRERLSGNGRGNPVILEPGYEVQSIGSPLKDLDLTNSRAVPEARICAEFLIPPEVVGLNVGMAHSTENNLAAAETRWTDRTLIPMWVQAADSWTMGLQSDIEGIKCEFDIQSVAAVKQQQGAKDAFIVDIYGKNLITKDEARSKLGYPELVEEIQPNELRSTVGGANAMKDLQMAYGQGAIDRDDAIATAELIFGFTNEEAQRLFKEKETTNKPNEIIEVIE